MTRPRLELAEVIRSCGNAFLDEYGQTLSPEQRRALAVLALQKTWISEGVALPGGGLFVSE